MATTTTINHGTPDLHHQNTVTLHHLGSLTHLKADGNLFAYSVSGDNSNDLILYTNSAQNDAMDFLLDGENGNGIGSSSSHESMVNLLDEGLGTSLDGTDEIPTTSTAHSCLGRNDSGVFSGDETTNGNHQSITSGQASSTITSADMESMASSGSQSTSASGESGSEETTNGKKNWPKNISPNRQGPQRCAVCGKTFSNASALTKHKLTHSDERKHACSICGKAFKRQDHLNGHMLTHRNKKPFECSVKGCGKSYCDARSLRRHVESRHGHDNLAMMSRPSAFQTSTNDSTSLDSKVTANEHPRTTKSKRKVKLPTTGNTLTQLPELLKESLSPTTDATNGAIKTVPEPVTNLSMPDSNLLTNGSLEGNVATVLRPCEGNKYVMVKLKDKLMMASPPVGADSTETHLYLRNTNNNNILISPETIATILSNAIVQETTKLTNDLLKVSIPPPNPTNQSQLHQLLTQRPSNAAATTPSTTSSPILSKTPGALNNKQYPSMGTETTVYRANWAANETKEVTEFCAETKDPGSVAKSPASAPGKIQDGSPFPTSSGESRQVSVPTAPPPALTGKTSSGRGTNSSATSPALLKEQLELIHQIIQQAQEECITNSTTTNKPKGFKGKKGKTTSALNNNSFLSPTKSKPETFEELSKVGSTDDKPVECTICFRRFKNTPALNGHMRLHGGYFKGGKDSEGKRKDSVTNGNKELSQTPLQTASISVRARIEEKIIQKRNTTLSVQGGEIGKGIPVESPVSVNSPFSSHGRRGSESLPEESSPEVPISPSVAQTFPHSTNVTTPETHSGLDEEADETFRFIYSQEDQDNAEYLLKDLEEEVFNKVSSICPESFLEGIIDESILSGGNGTEDLAGTEWSWTSSGDSRLHSIFNGPATITQDSPPCQFNKTNESEDGTSYSALPPLDPNVFYVSPTSQSPSVKSQDSPSFPYPTPPASLESHALQSPLFHLTNSSGPNSALGSSSNYYGFDPLTCSGTNSAQIVNMVEIEGGNEGECKVYPDPSAVDEIVLSLGEAIKRDVNSLISITKNFSEEGPGTRESVIKAESSGAGSKVFSEAIQFLTPSSSPTMTLTSTGSPLMEDPAVKELKVNEAAQMEAQAGNSPPSLAERLDVFLNPNSVPTSASSCLKSPKRKQVRNTFASNLRQQTAGSSSLSAHFTPYPILSPVRSAPGLYWTFSNKLSHVDECRRERARINVGLGFQATDLPDAQSPLLVKRKRKASCPLDIDEGGNDDPTQQLEQAQSLHEDILWNPDLMRNCSADEVDKYLEFACCSAVPGGGRNKEYALHLLNYCNGDINAALILLMNPEPQVPLTLREYKYPENAKWTRFEINAFQEGLLKYGKDFGQVANEIRTKSREDAVNFYHIWKKICSGEYEKIRNVWKKKDAAFTLDLLKSVPPPLLNPRLSPNHLLHSMDSRENSKYKTSSSEVLTAQHVPVDSSAGISFQSHEDYPCKICGKVFTKVKSRSAHMKSHRPPDQQTTDHKTCIVTTVQRKSKIGLPVMTRMVTTTNNNSPSAKSFLPSIGKTVPPPLLEIPEVKAPSVSNRDT